MAQRQTQHRFGLLQHHFSQQETVPVPTVSPSNILPDNVTTQTDTDTEYTGSSILSMTRGRPIPTHLDLTTYQPIPTIHDPMQDQSMRLVHDILQDQSIPTEPDPMQDQSMSIMSDIEPDQVMPKNAHTKKSRILRIVAVAIVLALALALYLIWRPAPSVSSSSLITPQNFSGAAPKISSSKSATTTDTATNSGGNIQAYIVGAVQHPGVYTLPANARVYQLLQSAGGPLPNANLVALNLAAKLNDGQEIYVTAIGESPPPGINSLSGTSSGASSSGASSTGSSPNQQLVNINTASADELHQKLSVSSKTAQAIVSYRQQHGSFTSVDQLLQVVSKSIYDKIKNKVTV